MAKTYNTIGTFTAGQVLTAAEMNEIGENSNNYRVPPMCRVFNSGNISPYTSGNPVTFDSESFDTDAMHNNVTNNSRITVGTAGVYVVTAKITITATTLTAVPTIRRNGTNITVGTGTSISEGGNFHMQVFWTGELAVNDYLETTIAVLASTGTVALTGGTTLNGSWFQATWLGQVS